MIILSLRVITDLIFISNLWGVRKPQSSNPLGGDKFHLVRLFTCDGLKLIIVLENND